MEGLSRVTLDQLRTLRALARLKSFTLAAEELCLSQPAVSVQIRALEKECGAALFDRMGKRVLLTQAGEIVLSCADDMLRRLDETQQVLDDLQGLRRGKLALAATHVVGIYTLPEILRDFREKHPGIKITLQIGFGHEVADRVLNGAVDLALLGERGSLKDDRLAVSRFMVNELVVVTSSRHPWVGRSSVSASELSGQPFIISRESSAVWQTLNARLKHVGVFLDTSLQFGSADGVKRAVEVGLGISVMPRTGITRDDLDTGRLNLLKLEGIPTEFDLFLIWLKDRRLPVVVQAFLAFLEREGPARPVALDQATR